MPEPIKEQRTIEGELLERSFTLDRSTVDEKKRTVEVAFSSEVEVTRWFGVEILDHSPESVDLGRLTNGGAVLVDHNHRDLVGTIESARIDADRKGRAVVRFGKSARAEEIFQDIADGIRRNVSVGYRINTYERTKREGSKPDVVRATRWAPYEISFVSIPADTSVGVGRSMDAETELKKKEAVNMPEAITQKREDTGISAPAAPVTTTATKIDQGQRDEILKDERTRVAGIERAYAQADGVSQELKERAIREGMTEMEFRAAAFEEIAPRPRETPDQKIEDIQRAEKKEFSLVRALFAKVEGDWSNAGFEREVSQELAREFSVVGGGLVVPMSVLASERATLTGERATLTTGAGLVADVHRPDLFIDTLRAETLLGALGARFLPGLTGNLSIPKKTGNASFGWVAEGVDASSSDVPVGRMALSGKHISGLVPMTFELIRQSSPAIETIVRQDILEGLALALDAAGFSGTGVDNQPLGLLNTTGIHTVTATDTTGKVPTWAEVVEMEGTLDDANALKGALSYVFRPTIFSALKTAKKDDGSGRFVIEKRECNGYTARSSTQVPALTSIFGNFNDIFIGLWGAVELIPKRNEKTGGLDIGCHQMADVAVRHAQSFCVIS